MINILLNKRQKEWVIRNVSKVLKVEEENKKGDVYKACIDILSGIKKNENLVSFNEFAAGSLGRMVEGSLIRLKGLTIPAYEKRGDDKYKKKAEKVVEDLEAMLKKIKFKLKGGK